MRKQKNRLIYLLLLVLFSFVLIEEVNAASFDLLNGDSYVCIKDDGSIVKNGSCGTAADSWNHNYIMQEVNVGEAYCAEFMVSFNGTPEESASDLVTEYAGAKCTYNNDSTIDCSEFIASIIRASEEIKDEYERWGTAQAHIWYFLGNNLNNKNSELITKNGNSSFCSGDNCKLASDSYGIFGKAKALYDENAKTVSNTDTSNIKYKVTVNNNNLYYVPSCTGEKYKLGSSITIENTSSQDLTIGLSVEGVSDGTVIQYNVNSYSGKSKSDRTGSVKDIPLLRGKKITIDGMTVSGLAASDKKITFKVEATGKVTKTNQSSYYDTVYHYISGNQNTLTLTHTNNSESNEEDGMVPKPTTLNIVRVDSNSCSGNGKYGSYDNSEPADFFMSSKSGVCANTVDAKKFTSDKGDDYTVGFSGCVCKTIDVNNKKVSILLKEDAAFQFGNLTPGAVFAGGGFSFVDTYTEKETGKKKAKGITTEYVSKVTWEYKDKINGSNYYYDTSSNSGETATSSVSNEIKGKISSMFDNNIDLNFTTISEENAFDNDSLGKFWGKDMGSSYKINLDLNENKDLYSFSYSSGPIKMNKACFSKTGQVRYFANGEECSSDYSIDGGNYYYVPLDYSYDNYGILKSLGENDGDLYVPFNFSGNLSIVGYDAQYKTGMFFSYAATCAVDIDDKTDCPPGDPDCPDEELEPPKDGTPSLYGIRYRSIDISDPFPKENNSNYEIPSNWKKWWSLSTNKYRMRNTFKYYGKPLYKISFKNISWNNNGDYNNWDNIKINGSSNFINNGRVKFEKSNGVDELSYCNLGEFSAFCDSLHN